MKIVWLVLFSCCLLLSSFTDVPPARAAAGPTPTPCPTSTSPLSTAVPC